MFPAFRRTGDFFKTVLGLFKRGDPPHKTPEIEPQQEAEEVKLPPREEQKVKEIPDVVRSELNLEQNAVFTVSTYREKSRTVIRTFETPKGTVERKVEIGKTASGAEVGVLTTTHFKLYLALLELWEKAGKPATEPVHFTVLRILKRLKLSNSGGNYETALKALAGLRDTPIRFADSFMDKTGTAKSTGHLSILAYLHTYERTAKTKSGTKTYGYGEFKFDDHILMSLIDDFTHPLRLNVITEFKKHRDLAILLYIYIDRQMAFRRKFGISLPNLFTQLDLSQSYIKYPSQRKVKLAPVAEELEGKELSTGTLSYCRIEKTKNGKDYKLVCRKKGVTQIAPPRKMKELDWSNIPLEKLLKEMEGGKDDS